MAIFRHTPSKDTQAVFCRHIVSQPNTPGTIKNTAMVFGSTTTTYCSTRGGAKGVSFENVVLQGLANDRGLYVPEELPSVSPEELTEVRRNPSSTFGISRFIVPSPSLYLLLLSWTCISYIAT